MPPTNGKVCQQCRKRLPACDCTPESTGMSAEQLAERWAFRYMFYPEEWPAEERFNPVDTFPVRE